MLRIAHPVNYSYLPPCYEDRIRFWEVGDTGANVHLIKLPYSLKQISYLFEEFEGKK